MSSIADEKSPYSPADSIARGAWILVVSQVLNSLLTFLTNRIILSTFTKEEHGVFFLVQQIGVFMMTCFVEAGMTTVTMGMVIRNPERQASILATLFKLRFMLWCGAAAMLVGVGWWYGADMVPLLLLWAVACLTAAKIQVQRGVLEIVTRAANNQVPAALAGLLDVLLLLALVWFDREHLTVLTVLLWYALSSVPGFVWLLVRGKQWRTLQTAFRAEVAREIMRLSFPVFVVVLMQQAHSVADALFLDALCSKRDVGVFGAAFRLVQQAFVFVMLWAQAMFPIIARLHSENEEECRRMMLVGVRVVMLVGVAFGMLACAAMPWAVMLSSGAAYMENIPEFSLFVWAIVPGFVQALLLTLNTAILWQKRNYVIFGWLLGVTLIGNAVLTPHYGVQGAIVTKMLSLTVSSAVALKVMAEFCGARPVVRLAAGFVVACAVGAVWSAVAPMYVPSVLARFCATIPIFAVLVAATRLLTRRDLVFARQFASGLLSGIASRVRSRVDR
jgi:O-antigen/teichoic acid export membrane protein